MSETLIPLTVLGSLGASVYFFTKVMTDYILKKKMIEKGYVNEESQSVFKSHGDKYASLKWGLIMLFGGLSLIMMEYIPIGPESPLPYGLFAMAVSIGFLIYYFLVKRETK